jgi:hypothetical protein
MFRVGVSAIKGRTVLGEDRLRLRTARGQRGPRTFPRRHADEKAGGSRGIRRREKRWGGKTVDRSSGSAAKSAPLRRDPGQHTPRPLHLARFGLRSPLSSLLCIVLVPGGRC